LMSGGIESLASARHVVTGQAGGLLDAVSGQVTLLSGAAAAMEDALSDRGECTKELNRNDALWAALPSVVSWNVTSRHSTPMDIHEMSTLRQKMAVRQASKDSHSIEIGEHRKQLALSPGAATDRTASTAHEMPGGGFMRGLTSSMTRSLTSGFMSHTTSMTSDLVGSMTSCVASGATLLSVTKNAPATNTGANWAALPSVVTWNTSAKNWLPSNTRNKMSPASAGVFGGLAAMQGMFAGGEKRESKANDLDIAQLKQLANDKQHEIDRLNSELVRERSKVGASVHRVEVEAGSQWAALPSVITWNTQSILPLTPARVTANASEAPTSSTFNILGGFLGGAAGSGKSPVDGRSGSDERQDEEVSLDGSLDMTRLKQYTSGLPPSMSHLGSPKMSGLLGSITARAGEEGTKLASVMEDGTSRLSPGRVRKSETSNEDSNSIKDTSNASNSRISSILAGLTDSVGGGWNSMRRSVNLPSVNLASGFESRFEPATSQNLDCDVESRRKKEQGAVTSEMRGSDEGAILGGGKFEEMGPEIRWNRDSIPAIGRKFTENVKEDSWSFVRRTNEPKKVQDTSEKDQKGADIEQVLLRCVDTVHYKSAALQEPERTEDPKLFLRDLEDSLFQVEFMSGVYGDGAVKSPMSRVSRAPLSSKRPMFAHEIARVVRK